MNVIDAPEVNTYLTSVPKAGSIIRGIPTGEVYLAAEVSKRVNTVQLIRLRDGHHSGFLDKDSTFVLFADETHQWHAMRGEE